MPAKRIGKRFYAKYGDTYKVSFHTPHLNDRNVVIKNIRQKSFDKQLQQMENKQTAVKPKAYWGIAHFSCRMKNTRLHLLIGRGKLSKAKSLKEVIIMKKLFLSNKDERSAFLYKVKAFLPLSSIVSPFVASMLYPLYIEWISGKWISLLYFVIIGILWGLVIAFTEGMLQKEILAHFFAVQVYFLGAYFILVSKVLDPVFACLWNFLSTLYTNLCSFIGIK